VEASRPELVRTVESWWFRVAASPASRFAPWLVWGIVTLALPSEEQAIAQRLIFVLAIGGGAAISSVARFHAGPYQVLRPLRSEHRVEVLRAVRHGGMVSRVDLYGYVLAFAEREQRQDDRRWFAESRLARLLLALWAPVLLLAWWAADTDARLWVLPVALGALGVVATRAIVAAERRRVPNRMRAHELAFPSLGIGPDDVLRP
jgi:hypothetical protein